MPRSPAAALNGAIITTVMIVTGAAILAGCGSDDGGDASEFCAGVAANVTAVVPPPGPDGADVDATLDVYRELADVAPISIEEEWRDLLLMVETASTVVPEDPESMQRTVAVAYATERSAVAVKNWVLANCGVDLGPVATIAPQDPAATTTLPPDVSTSIVTVVPPPTTTLAPEVAATTPPTQAAPATTAASG